MTTLQIWTEMQSARAETVTGRTIKSALTKYGFEGQQMKALLEGLAASGEARNGIFTVRIA